MPTPENTKSTGDEDRFNVSIEINEGQRQLLSLGAMHQRKTIPQFVLDAAIEKANQEYDRHSHGPCLG